MQIITYDTLIANEGGKKLQRGMNFGMGITYSIILMSVEKNAPYNDVMLDDGAIIIWCRDWSEITEKNQNFQDDFVINITSKEFTEWNNKNK